MANSVESSFQSDAAFIEIENRLAAEKTALMKKVNGLFRFELSEGPEGAKGVWYIDAKKEGKIYRGSAHGLKADCTIKMKDSDCIKLLSGQLNPQAAFLQGKVKVSGNMGLAMKLQQLQGKLKSKSSPASPVSVPVSVESSFQSDAAFIEIEKRLVAEKTALMKKVNGTFCFELSEGPKGAKGVWYIDAKKEGKIYRGSAHGLKADCTIKMKDSDCIKLLSGKLNPQAAFLQGKVKVSGNMGLAMKLQQLQGKLKSKL